MNNIRKRHPDGFMALMLLITVAIALVLYMSLMKALLPEPKGGRADNQDRPWLLEDLIEPDGKIIDMPEPPKIEITKDIEIKAKVSRDGSNRGVAELKFYDNGTVSGKWLCDYTHEERQYSYIATYAGNIVNDKVFSDETGKDKSKLFFIAKGEYNQRVYHPDMGEKLTKGIIYLTGWLGADKSIVGLLTVTTGDRAEERDKWSASYDLLSEGL